MSMHLVAMPNPVSSCTSQRFKFHPNVFCYLGGFSLMYKLTSLQCYMIQGAHVYITLALLFIFFFSTPLLFSWAGWLSLIPSVRYNYTLHLPCSRCCRIYKCITHSGDFRAKLLPLPFVTGSYCWCIYLYIYICIYWTMHFWRPPPTSPAPRRPPLSLYNLKSGLPQNWKFSLYIGSFPCSLPKESPRYGTFPCGLQ